MTKRKDGRWMKIVVIDGKSVSFYSTADTERKALKDIEQQIIERQGQKLSDEVSLERIADAWADKHYDTISDKTRAEYEPMRKRIINEFGKRTAASIQPHEVDRFIQNFAAQNYSRNTVAALLLVFKMIMRFAVVNSVIDVSPCEYIKIPKKLPHKDRELPTDEEIEKIKASVNEPFGLFAYFVLYSGLRRGEALALTYEDIDFDAGTITINKTIEYNSNKPKIKQHTKTDAGMRTVVLLDVLASVLPHDKHGLVFTDANGGLMSQQSYKRHYERYKKITGVTCTAHQIRHAYATILYEAGIEDKDTQRLMGHADISTTRNIYQHIRDKKLDDSRNKLNAYLNKANI